MNHPPVPVLVARNPIHAMLAPFPVVCFTLTLLTDIAFWQTANLMWQNFSSWLLFAGLVIGALALLAAAVGLLIAGEGRAHPTGWLHVVGDAIVLALAFVNSLVHAGDGWTAVVPNGLILSAVTVAVICVTAWLGRSVAMRYASE